MFYTFEELDASSGCRQEGWPYVRLYRENFQSHYLLASAQGSIDSASSTALSLFLFLNCGEVYPCLSSATSFNFPKNSNQDCFVFS